MSSLPIRSLRLNVLGQHPHVHCARFYSSHSAAPRIASLSFWASLVPKPFRKSSRESPKPSAIPKSRGWNPATFFIVMSILIGSNAIQLVSLRTHQLNYNRATEAKLRLLREVINRVQNGEDVDVETMLGKGDARQEQEWEEVIKELEKAEDPWPKQKGKTHKRDVEQARQSQSTLSEETLAPHTQDNIATGTKPRFY